MIFPAFSTTTTSPDLVGVVEAGAADGRAGQFDRLQLGDRRDRARLAHLHANVVQPGGRLVLLELVGDDPAGTLRGGAQPLALVEPVDLQDQPVDLEVQLVEPLDQLLAMFHGRVKSVEAGDVRRGRQAVARQLVEEFHVRRRAEPFDAAHAVAEEPKPPLRAEPRVQQPDAAGGDVPRVGVGRFALLALRLVQQNQVGVGHVDLAAHFEHRRDVRAR
jgi:hypothetical protein